MRGKNVGLPTPKQSKFSLNRFIAGRSRSQHLANISLDDKSLM